MNQQKHHDTCKISPAVIDEIDQALHRAENIMSSVDQSFVPWIGKSYGNEGLFDQKRILVLGASHYEWCKACSDNHIKRGRDLTCRCVAELVAPNFSEPPLQHWLKIQYALTGEKANDVKSRRSFWHSVAYYNYIQEMVGYWGDEVDQERPLPPTPEMWEAAEKPFLKVIQQIKPDLIVVLGDTMWSQLPEEDESLSTLIAGNKKLYRCSYSKSVDSEKPVVACCVRHPAAGLGLPWHPVLKKCFSLL
jgi:hypothetical protein